MNVRSISVLAGALALASSVLAGPPFAERTPGGDALVVPSEAARQGTVYHALPGRDRQVLFRSEAPLETIKGQSNRVIGYVVATPGSSDQPLRTGEWHLPVESMSTGIPLRDEHLAGSDWLDAANHPDIVFQLEEVRDVERTRRSEAFETFKATLVGEMTIHGVTNPIEIAGATITFLNESDATRKIADGDLLAIRASYAVRLADYDVSHPVVGDKVANEVRIETTLYMSTVPPAEQ